ncbi:MAG: TetR/AcrR family transcriptional regulator [Chlamydiota bacterium]|nr:TetR/AcrR family transcriptional regulator [Chlamydiota bacterium]
MGETKKRTYNSKNRENQAKHTKSRILQSAKELFQNEGFDRVTIQQLAQAADVSMPTIYAIFKSKRGVLQSLIDEALPQDEFSDLVQESMNELSAKKRLAKTARMARKIYDAERELMGILSNASLVAPEFKELEYERETRRYARQGKFISFMMDNNHLSSTLSLTKARDILWTLTGRDIYRMFVIERGWTSQEYENWLEKTLIETLLS